MKNNFTFCTKLRDNFPIEIGNLHYLNEKSNEYERIVMLGVGEFRLQLVQSDAKYLSAYLAHFAETGTLDPESIDSELDKSKNEWTQELASLIERVSRRVIHEETKKEN